MKFNFEKIGLSEEEKNKRAKLAKELKYARSLGDKGRILALAHLTKNKKDDSILQDSYKKIKEYRKEKFLYIKEQKNKTELKKLKSEWNISNEELKDAKKEYFSNIGKEDKKDENKTHKKTLDIISEAVLKSRNRKGRPPFSFLGGLLEEQKNILDYMKNHSLEETMNKFNISRATVYRYKKKNEINNSKNQEQIDSNKDFEKDEIKVNIENLKKIKEMEEKIYASDIIEYNQETKFKIPNKFTEDRDVREKYLNLVNKALRLITPYLNLVNKLNSNEIKEIDSSFYKEMSNINNLLKENERNRKLLLEEVNKINQAEVENNTYNIRRASRD